MTILIGHFTSRTPCVVRWSCCLGLHCIWTSRSAKSWVLPLSSTGIDSRGTSKKIFCLRFCLLENPICEKYTFYSAQIFCQKNFSKYCLRTFAHSFPNAIFPMALSYFFRYQLRCHILTKASPDLQPKSSHPIIFCHGFLHFLSRHLS